MGKRIAHNQNNVSCIVTKSAVAVAKNVLKAKTYKIYFNKRIVSEIRAQRKLFPLFITSVLWIKNKRFKLPFEL